MTRFAILAWAGLVAWGCSGLLHAVDSDITSTQELVSPSTLVSISAISLVFLVPILTCLFALDRYRWQGFAIAAGVCAVIAGVVMAVLGSTAGSASAWLVSALGMVVVMGIVLTLGALPAMRSMVLRGRRSD